MNYQDGLVQDFARRTRVNLDTLRRLQWEAPDAEVYEVTQLVNSMLGLLVFPQQRFYNRIPKIGLEELAEKGWPVPEVEGDYPQVEDLQQLVKYLRNAVAHFNVEFVADGEGQINGLKVWNTRPRSQEITWKARLTIGGMEKITDMFIELLLGEEGRERT